MRTFKQWERLITEAKDTDLVASLMDATDPGWSRIRKTVQQSHMNCVKSCPQWYSMWRFTGVKLQPSKCPPERTQRAKGNDRFSSCFYVSIKSNDISKNMLEPSTSNRKTRLTGEDCGTGRKCPPMESQKHCTAGPTCVVKYHLHCFRYVISATCIVQHNRNWMTLKSQLNFQCPQ